MPKFQFTALALDGTRVAGIEDASTLGDVHTLLADRDLLPIRVAEKKSILHYEITKKRVKPRDLMHFSRQLGVFIRAGIPIINALEVILSEMTDKVFKPALEDMIESLRGGSTFSAAAARHDEVFPPFYLGILRSAEVTGNLDNALDELADYLDRDIDTRQKVVSALAYPAIVLVMAVVVVVVLTVFVLPRFETFFESFHATLPLPTRMLLSVAHFIGEWGWLIALTIAVVVVGSILYARTERGRAAKDAMLLRLPVAGDLIRHAIVERFCRILASMLNAGVPVPEALAVTGDATNNTVFRDGIADAREAMMRGEGLARPLNSTDLFPSSIKQMLRVGEDTGTLDTQLETAANYLDRELDYKIKRFTSLFEPAVIIFVGIIVGFVAIALVSAMYGIYNQVNVS
ncbi:MAG TPA: type II secretion system F family protein [Acidimicrobiales bacterium]|jgi:type IV pilus assembly protein PilC